MTARLRSRYVVNVTIELVPSGRFNGDDPDRPIFERTIIASEGLEHKLMETLDRWLPRKMSWLRERAIAQDSDEGRALAGLANAFHAPSPPTPESTQVTRYEGSAPPRSRAWWKLW